MTSERNTGHRDSLAGHPKIRAEAAEEGRDTGSAAPARSARSRHQAGSQSAAGKAWCGREWLGLEEEAARQELPSAVLGDCVRQMPRSWPPGPLAQYSHQGGKGAPACSPPAS